jgi:hypothetical protein
MARAKNWPGFSSAPKTLEPEILCVILVGEVESGDISLYYEALEQQTEEEYYAIVAQTLDTFHAIEKSIHYVHTFRSTKVLITEADGSKSCLFKFLTTFHFIFHCIQEINLYVLEYIIIYYTVQYAERKRQTASKHQR